MSRMSPRLKARIAGILYLLIIAGGLLAPFAVAPTGMMLGDGALPTAAKILASKSVYVLGGATQLTVYACDIGVALLFYELLKPVNKSLALLAAFFRLVFVAVASANMVNHFAPLIVLSDAGYMHAFNPSQLQAIATVFIRLRTLGFDVALVFFGMHCILIGYLIFRSSFLPRLLGAALAMGGIGYLANIFSLSIPTAVAPLLFPYVMLPAGFAEVALTLWLIVAGVNVARWEKRAAL